MDVKLTHKYKTYRACFNKATKDMAISNHPYKCVKDFYTEQYKTDVYYVNTHKKYNKPEKYKSVNQCKYKHAINGDKDCWTVTSIGAAYISK